MTLYFNPENNQTVSLSCPSCVLNINVLRSWNQAQKQFLIPLSTELERLDWYQQGIFSPLGFHNVVLFTFQKHFFIRLHSVFVYLDNFSLQCLKWLHVCVSKLIFTSREAFGDISVAPRVQSFMKRRNENFCRLNQLTHVCQHGAKG